MLHLAGTRQATGKPSMVDLDQYQELHSVISEFRLAVSTVDWQQ